MVERRAGSLERAADRRVGALEHLGDLAGLEAEDVSKHEHRPLTGSEVLQAHDERERHRLSGLVA